MPLQSCEKKQWGQKNKSRSQKEMSIPLDVRERHHQEWLRKQETEAKEDHKEVVAVPQEMTTSMTNSTDDQQEEIASITLSFVDRLIPPITCLNCLRGPNAFVQTCCSHCGKRQLKELGTLPFSPVCLECQTPLKTFCCVVKTCMTPARLFL